MRSDFRAYLAKGEVAATDWKHIAVGVAKTLNEDEGSRTGRMVLS